MIRIEGKKVSLERQEQLKNRVAQFKEATGVTPGLAVVLVGEDPASQVYVRNKIKACGKVGIESMEHRLPESISQDELHFLIDRLNEDPQVHGILVQLPLPQGLESEAVVNRISPKKDADGLSVENLGWLWSGQPRSIPCTPNGVMKMLEYYDIDLKGKNAVVMGRSQIVGKPMAQLLLNANATVTVCHGSTKNAREFTQKADLVVVATGRPRFFGREDFKQGSVVIDVGIHRSTTEEGKTKLFGDVRFEELEDWVYAATPVPGGVGPMTITMLLENTLKLADLSFRKTSA